MKVLELDEGIQRVFGYCCSCFECLCVIKILKCQSECKKRLAISRDRLGGELENHFKRDFLVVFWLRYFR